MTGEMSCYVLHGQRDIRLEKRVIPSPRPDEVLIKMKRVGVCGSDIHYFEHGRVGNFVVKHPFVIGHEGAGEVAELGSAVTSLKLGDRVAIDPSQPCHKCEFCKKGQYNLCPEMHYLGSAATNPHTEGLFAEYFTMPASNCYPIPDGMSDSGAAMLEPLSVAMHVVERSAVKESSSILITGGGTIGQLVLLVLRTMRVRKIAVSEILEERRRLALKTGADIVLDPSDAQFRTKALDFSSGGFDVVIEASGAPVAVKQSIELAHCGGTAVLVGLSLEDVSLPTNRITTKELTVEGSYRFTNVFNQAIKLVASGKIDLNPLISEIMPFAKLKEAIELAGSKGDVIKVQVEI